MARLGLTSIPYTKLHASLAQLLHKQGFLSQVHLGGPSPPAACFPAAVPDNHHISAAPHRDRSPTSPEAALDDVVHNRARTPAALRALGYDTASIAHALDAGRLTLSELDAAGWTEPALDFLLTRTLTPPGELQPLAPEAQSLVDNANLPSHLERLPVDLPAAELSSRLRHRLLSRQVITRDLLAYIAGPAAFHTPRQLAQTRPALSHLSLDLPTSQPPATLPPEYRDPHALEHPSRITHSNRASRRLWLGLKYWEGSPVLTKARLISKPTKRLWLNSRELGLVVRGSAAGEVRGMGKVGECVFVSTDRGVMEARECVERRVGGTALCRVW